MHQHAKFRQNRSIVCKDTKSFQFFKMAATAILEFQNREFLFADGIWREQTHHGTKFCQKPSFVTEILRFFEFSRWPPPLSWIFEIAKFYSLFRS